ncbi:unnamed protein product, partial [Mesorhabditis belari]|uniref:Copper transport protein n=1 Tax=Mesorhabditis belari TaxID=2138241 RepID=A0AAF3EEX7_9BILA
MAGHDHSAHAHHPANFQQESTTMPSHEMGHSMSFHFGQMETILFKWWMPDSAGGMFFSCLLVFLFCVAYETVKFFRQYRDIRNALETTLVEPEARLRPKISAQALVDLPLHIIQIIFAYALMLIFMTFNVWLCLAIVLGESLSHLFYRITFPHINSIESHC